MYSPPISTRYGQVYWTMMDKVPLPDAIVKRFDNKPIAIMGYEEDQVFANGTSVPINWAYNHHYVPVVILQSIRVFFSIGTSRVSQRRWPGCSFPRIACFVHSMMTGSGSRAKTPR